MAEPFGPSRVENAANPELAIAHPRQLILDIMGDAGFAQTGIFNGNWSGRSAITQMDFQDLIIADCSPGAVLRPDPQTEMLPEPLTPDQDCICSRIYTLTGGEELRVSRFLTWCNALALNAFWWQCDGWTLALADEAPAGNDRWSLRFDAVRGLGLEDIRPDSFENIGKFHVLDDAAMIAFLLRADRAASRCELLNTFFEAAENGFYILDAIEAGKAFVLLAPQRAPLPVHLPMLSS